MVTTGVDSVSRSPLTWTNNLMVIIEFNFDYITSDEREVVQLLDEFKDMSSHVTLILDRERHRDRQILE